MGDRIGKPISQRQLRVGEMIKQSLSMIFIKNEAKVPNLETNMITVTEVKMSQDLKIAKAYVLPLGGKDAEETLRVFIVSSASFPPSGSTYALAIFKSGLILTSVTVIVFVSKFGTLASFLIKIMLKDCLIISPTLSCLCEIGFPILSAIKLFSLLKLH